MDDKKGVRKKNFTLDENSTLREEYAKHKNYLTSSFNNTVDGEKVTKKGKHDRWEIITSKINSLGVENRTSKEIQGRWKNIVTEAKGKFHHHKRVATGTGGGPPPPPISDGTMKVIELLKDDASFQGVPGGGFSMFKKPSSSPLQSPPNPNALQLLSMQEDSDDNTNDCDEVEQSSNSNSNSEAPKAPKCGSGAGKKAPLPHSFIKSAVAPPPKRKHYETTTSLQQRVLEEEESIQQMKKKSIKLKNEKYELEIENAKLLRRKLRLEIDVLEKQAIDSCKDPADTSSYLNILYRSATDGDDQQCSLGSKMVEDEEFFS